MLPEGYSDVPAGHLAAAVTYLEMRERPTADRIEPPPGISVRRVENPALDWYRSLFRRVGEHWLWTSRLAMNDGELGAIIRNPAVDLFALSHGGADKGLLELDRREFAEIELAFFGITPDLIGRGAGRYLMQRALDEVWPHRPARFWVHTCTLDHPKALGFYIKAGFVPYKRAVEVMPDPRLSGIHPLSAAPQIPVLR
jgi:GNAT superfamily N-acetyltransferase